MYKTPARTSTSLNVNQSVEGNTIEEQITELLNNGAPIESEKIPIYTKPSDGVKYGTDIRGDKWEKGIETSEKINADIDRIRAMKVVKKDEENNDGEKGGEKGDKKGNEKGGESGSI